jgi:flavin reductase (DIM6/NTAB) family NADH-FMN oxidoreductase RutF
MNPQMLTPEFKSAMRRLTTTVSVVTCMHEETWYGMTATAVTSVCVDPPAIQVCINESATIYRPLIESSRFCVNLLRVDHQAISTAFGGRLTASKRFREGEWIAATAGIPALIGAQANIFAKVAQVVPYGTHGIIIGAVESVILHEEIAPLLYQNGGYARAECMVP